MLVLLAPDVTRTLCCVRHGHGDKPGLESCDEAQRAASTGGTSTATIARRNTKFGTFTYAR